MSGILQGMSGLVKALNGFATGCAAARQKAGQRIGMRCMAIAKRNAPVGPTLTDLSRGLKRKKRVTHKSRPSFKEPGGLEKSIRYEVLPNGDVSVFVPSNGLTRTKSGYNYAKRIHDEKGVAWHKLGAGTVRKGQQADEKFIQRARDEHAEEWKRIYKQEIDKELKGL